MEPVLKTSLLCSLLKVQNTDDVAQVVIKESYSLFVSSKCLWAFYYDSTSAVLVFENIVAIVSFDDTLQQFLALSSDGYLLILQFDGACSMREVALFDLNTILTLVGDIDSTASLVIHSNSQYLLCHSQCTGFAVMAVDFSNSTINVIKIMQIFQTESPSLLSAFWGLSNDCNDTCCLVTCSQSTTLNVWNISIHSRTPNESVDESHLERPADYGSSPTLSPSPLSTKHRGWPTALSTSMSPCDLGASGDCLGTLCLWRCSSTRPEASGDPLQLLLTDRTVSSGHSIGAVLIDGQSETLWVADCSGTVSCLILNLRGAKATLEKLARITAFMGPSSRGASVLQWREGLQTSDTTDSRPSGVLRCYCPHSGMLVECSVPHNASSVFRVWPSFPLTNAYTSLVECCDVISDMHCVIAAGGGQFVYVYDMNTGRLVHTIRTENSMCRNLAVLQTAPEICLIATGHSNGAVSIFKLSAVAEVGAGRNFGEHESLDRDPNGSQRVEQSLGASSESVSGVALFDIIGADSEVLVNKRTLSQSVSRRDSQEVLQDPIDAREIDGADEERHPQQQYQLQQQHEPKYSHTVMCSTRTFSPLPVTDLFLSSLGGFLVVCYLRKFVCVYSLAADKVTKSLTLDAGVLHVAVVMSTEDAPAGHDSLILSVQTAQKITLLDVVHGVVLTDFEMQTNHADVMCSGLWDQPLNNRSGDRSIAGLCVTKDFKIFLFGDLSGFVQHSCIIGEETEAVPQTSAKHSKRHTSSNKHSAAAHSTAVIQGLQVYAAGHSPLAAVWSLRRLVVLRVTLDNYSPEVMRTLQIRVGDDKVRVVRAIPLKALSNVRSHRVLVVLSDGSAYILHV